MDKSLKKALNDKQKEADRIKKKIQQKKERAAQKMEAESKTSEK